MQSTRLFALPLMLAVLVNLIAPSHVLAATIAPNVHIMDADHKELLSFTALADKGALVQSVVAHDLGADGVSEIIAGAALGKQPYVGVYRQDGSKILDFLAYGTGFTGGVSVAVCDLRGDGQKEIVTGAGLGGSPHVRVFTNTGVWAGIQFYAYDRAFNQGVVLACTDLNGDGKDEIITAPEYGSAVARKVFNGSGDEQISLHADSVNLQIPTTVGTNTFTSIIAESGESVSISAPNLLATDLSPQYIRVDLSEQRLIAYENGVPIRTFLVSTGTKSHPTPVKKTTVLAKIPVMTYAWNYGPGNPNNYNLPGVQWNMRILPHIYIHSAYWHHNFGHVMSHGCINTSIPDADWIYHWANVGASVETVQ